MMRYLWIPVLFVAWLMGGDTDGYAIAIAPIIGGAIAGVGALGGGLAGAFGGQADEPPAPGVGFLPNIDTIAAGAQGEAGLGIGVFDPAVLNQTAPARQLSSAILALPDGIMDANAKQQAVGFLNKASRMGLFSKFKQEVAAGNWSEGEIWTFMVNQPGFAFTADEMANLKGTGFGSRNPDEITFTRNGQTLLRADALAGAHADMSDDSQNSNMGRGIGGLRAISEAFDATATDIPKFVESQERFETVIPEMQSKQDALAREVFEGRLDLQSAINDLTVDVSNLASSGFAGLEDSPFAQSLLAEHNRSLRESRQDILDRSGVGGYNPGEELAKLTQQDTVFRDELPLNATGQLLNMLSGLQAVQQPALDNATRAGNIRNQQVVDASGVSAAQYNAFVNAAGATDLNNADNFGGGLNAGIGGAGAGILAGLTYGQDNQGGAGAAGFNALNQPAGAAGFNALNQPLTNFQNLQNFDPNITFP
jgi:hypothetical protein